MLIRTKLSPPPPMTGRVDRAAHGWTDRVLAARLTIVQAPAGYGKTDVMAAWHDRLRAADIRTGWLTCHSEDNSCDRFLDYVAAMLGDAWPGLGNRATIAGLVDTLIRLDKPLCLFIDRVDWLGAEALADLALLIDHAPPAVRFVVATRQRPPSRLRVQLLRSQNRLCDVGVEALRFSGEEAARLFAAVGLTSMAAEQVDAVVERTEGWAAGLKLAALTLSGVSDLESAIERLSGRSDLLFDYLAEVVFDAQPPETQDFLLRSSVPARFTAPLYDQLSATVDGAHLIERARAGGLFLVPLDDRSEWFRYHRPFADFLRRKAEATLGTELAAIHRSISLWLFDRGHFAASLDAALASGDQLFLADVLDRQCDLHIAAADAQTVAHYASMLPRPLLAQYPRVLLAIAWMKARNMRLDEARNLLFLAREQLFAEGSPSPRLTASTLPEGERDRLRLTLAQRELVVMYAEDDFVSVERACQQLIGQFPASDPYSLCGLYAMAIWSQREQFRLDGIEALIQKARTTADAAGCKAVLITLMSVAASALLAMGQGEEALAAAETSYQQGLARGGPGSNLAAHGALPLIEILYERNELDRAEALAVEYLHHAQEEGLCDELIAGYGVYPRILAGRGDLAGALRVLAEGARLALAHDLGRLRLTVARERIRLFLANGEPAKALKVGEKAAIPGPIEAILPRPDATTRDEIRAECWTRLALSRLHLADARRAAQQWAAFCTGRGAVRRAAQWQLLLAQILLVDGDARSAQRALRTAVKMAEPGGLIRCFVDAGTAVQQLLDSKYAGSPGYDPTESFAQRIRAACIGRDADAVPVEAEQEGLFGGLLERELEILGLVGSGMLNREIADRLGVTEGSVKWYLQKIYDKLGIRRRTQAVERARSFGLMRRHA